MKRYVYYRHNFISSQWARANYKLMILWILSSRCTVKIETVHRGGREGGAGDAAGRRGDENGGERIRTVVNSGDKRGTVPPI